MQVSIFSEINPLKSVLIHRPGNEHSFVDPMNLSEWIPENNTITHNPNYLLFDDLINPEKAMKEHDLLSQVINNFIGEENCIEFITLLIDIINNIELRKELLKECLELEDSINNINNFNSKLSELISMDTHEILHVLLTGFNTYDNGIQFFKHPIPNLIFTRDIAAVIGKTILLTWGCKTVRNRENILAKFIFNYHEIFNDTKTYNFNEHHPNLSVEGGDIIILDDKTICIGISERTSSETIDALLPLFFQEGFLNVYAFDLPKCRSMMHLDTIFNRINNKEVIVFPPMFLSSETNNETLTIHCISNGQKFNEGKKTTQSFLELIKNNGLELTPIKCGGDKKLHQAREQWMDGANYFTISPGIIIGYGRNHHTIIELKKAGYKCIDAIEFLKNKHLFDNQSKLMISIPSAELSRGRGGARCLTLPLIRKENND